MLLINGEKFKPTKEYQEFVKEFKKPIVFRIHDSRMNPDPKTKKMLPPRTQGVETAFKIYHKGEEIEYRYATAFPSKPGGSYTPEYLFFEKRGEITCDPKKPDDMYLAWFLHMNPYNESGPNFDASKRPIYVLVNKREAAKKNVSNRKDKYIAEQLITEEWEKDPFMLSEVAKAFDIAEVEDKSTEELQDDLLKIMDVNPTQFLERVYKEDIHRRALIVEGLATGILEFNQNDKKWYWGEITSKKNTVITEVKVGEDPKSSLVRFFNKAFKEDNLEYFQNLINKKRAESGSTKKHTESTVSQ